LTPDQVQQSIRELDQLGSQMRKWRTATLVVVLAASILFGLTLTRAVQALTRPGPTRDLFTTRLREGLQKEVLPEVKDLAKNSAAEVTPLVMAELQNIQLQAPRYGEALKTELNTLKANIPHRAEEILNDTVGQVIRDREQQVREMFPDLTEEKVKKLVENLADESKVRLVKVVDEVTHPQQKSLENILASLEQIHASEADAIKDEKPSMEMLLVFLDLFQIDLGQEQASPESNGGEQ